MSIVPIQRSTYKHLHSIVTFYFLASNRQNYAFRSYKQSYAEIMPGLQGNPFYARPSTTYMSV